MSAVDHITATMPEPWTILGLRLRPFSISHYKLLLRFKCAFVSETEAFASREDLILGALICSMAPNEFLAFIELPDYAEQIKSWGKACGLFDLPSRASMFKRYIDESSIIPKHWIERNGGASAAHWTLCLETTLRSKLGWTQEDLDTKTISQAFAEYFKHAENEGAVKLMTPDEISLCEEVQGGA